MTLEQADGTAWMAYYALSMLVIALVLAEENEVYEDMVIKFLEQFVLVARALERQGLYDAEDAFFYDRLVYPSGESTQVQGARPSRVCSRCCPPCRCRPGSIESAERLGKRVRAAPRRLDGDRRERSGSAASARTAASRRARLGDRPGRRSARRSRAFFDEAAFLSPHGLRAVSKRYEGNPYTLEGVPGAWIDYEPAESTTSMFGGNSNWRGPIWMPLNYLAIRQFVHLPAVLRRRLHGRVPDGLGPAAHLRRDRPGPRRPDRLDLAARAPTAAGPLFGGTERLQTDPAWKDNLFFYEYFHGDNGAGLGATHQTGWTALVADLILDPPSAGARLGLGGVCA